MCYFALYLLNLGQNDDDDEDDDDDDDDVQ